MMEQNKKTIKYFKNFLKGSQETMIRNSCPQEIYTCMVVFCFKKKDLERMTVEQLKEKIIKITNNYLEKGKGKMGV